MSLLNPLATALSRVFSGGARPAMELSFSQMQNSLIRRLNTEIAKVNEGPSDVARLHDLQRDNAKFKDQIQQVGKYIFDNQSNLGKLEELSASVTELASIFGSDGNDLDVTADEAAAFEAKRDEVVDKINSLYVLSYPDIANTGRIRDLLDQVETLSAMVPDVGAVDPEGTDPANNNRQIADFTTDLVNKVSVAITVSEETIFMASQMHKVANEKVYQTEADILQLTQVEQAERVQEIEDLKVEYANLMKAVSLSYEVSIYYTENLAKQLNGTNRPEQGSVLNLFS